MTVAETKEATVLEKEVAKPTVPRYIRVLKEDFSIEEELPKADIKLLLNDIEAFYSERVKHYHALRIQKIQES